VLSSGVKHGTNNHKTRSDRTFTHPEDETDGEETCKVLAGGMATQRNSPYEYVEARDAPLQKMEVPSTVWTTCLIHFPTGNLCNARFWGNSKAR
jgi:hypothetical protein